MNLEQAKDEVMTIDQYVKKYCGEFPDGEGRKLAKTWEELRAMMKEDLEAMLKSKWEEACEEQQLVYFPFVNNECKPEFKP